MARCFGLVGSGRVSEPRVGRPGKYDHIFRFSVKRLVVYGVPRFNLSLLYGADSSGVHRPDTKRVGSCISETVLCIPKFCVDS